jgi:hypothetical protein
LDFWLSITAGRTSSWRTGLWPYSRRLAGDRDPLKTRSPRADNPLVLCQCSAPNHYATRRFAARYCTRRERQARHPQPKPGRQPLLGFRCFWRSLAICHARSARHSCLPVTSGIPDAHLQIHSPVARSFRGFQTPTFKSIHPWPVRSAQIQGLRSFRTHARRVDDASGGWVSDILHGERPGPTAAPAAVKVQLRSVLAAREFRELSHHVVNVGLRRPLAQREVSE